MRSTTDSGRCFTSRAVGPADLPAGMKKRGRGDRTARRMAAAIISGGAPSAIPLSRMARTSATVRHVRRPSVGEDLQRDPRVHVEGGDHAHADAPRCHLGAQAAERGDERGLARPVHREEGDRGHRGK